MPRNRHIYLAREPSKLRFWSEIPPELAPIPPCGGKGPGDGGALRRATHRVAPTGVLSGLATLRDYVLHSAQRIKQQLTRQWTT